MRQNENLLARKNTYLGRLAVAYCSIFIFKFLTTSQGEKSFFNVLSVVVGLVPQRPE